MQTSVSGRTGIAFTLRGMLFAGVGALSLLAVGTSGWDAVNAVRLHSEARQVEQFDQGVNKFVTGLFEVLMERLYTNNGLQAADPAPPAVLAEIEKRRKLVRDNYEAGLAVIKAQDFPNKSVLIAELEGALAKANQYRNQADAALKLPRDQRDENLRKTFIPTITASVDASLKLWFAALHHAAQNDPTLSRLAVVKEIGWRMRDFSGKERSDISQAIAAGAPIPANALVSIAGYRARVDILWQQLENLTQDPNTPTPIKQAIAGARDQYFGAFLRLSEEMKKASEAGGKYNTTSSQYVETTTPQIGSLLQVMYAAGQASEAHTASQKSSAFATLMGSLAMIALALGLSAAVGMVVARRVVRPLRNTTTIMDRLAQGDTAVSIPYVERQDEVGAMARSVQVFKDNMIEADRLRAEQAAEQERQLERAKRIQGSVSSFEQAVASVVQTVTSAATGLQNTAQAMNTTADSTARQSSAVASASEEATANVQTVASATEELSASIGEISQQVTNASRMVGDAVSKAERSNEQVRGLTEAAQKIGDVVKIIADIAGQTNLLALNATIEAARAGEAGKGFAVVASEVKALANQTAKATEEIASQVKAIQDATQVSAESIKDIADTIAKVSETSATIASAVEEQGAATQEIARNVQQAARGTQEVSGNIGGVSEAAGQTGAAAAEVLASAQELSRNGDLLRQQVDAFLREVRAA